MDYATDPNAILVELNTLKILLVFLMIGSLIGFLFLARKLQERIDRLQASINVHYKMTLSLMATVPGALQHNRETYEESDEEDFAAMNREAPN